MSQSSISSQDSSIVHPNAKLVAFSVGQLTLAARIEQVDKVVNLPTVYGSGLKPVGLAQVDEHDITVIDLQRHLFGITAQSMPTPYLILLHTRSGEGIGIPVSDTPILIEVPTNLIRSLPASYRRADTLEIASHIAIISEAEQTRTLFLLDVEQLSSSIQIH
ncbi:chemotaxis protein CheW [Leptolyngbya sp. NK1-12]|uniref:Chemotaxis protein CheW n=1 Tax=Leptolyngbya sp. NK1-12 TaxID=2547451 RepID=A0AA96WEI9_9CYAN|nr:chemotaxis protein CheW [Leptolyngbya sp. NK1-12]